MRKIALALIAFALAAGSCSKNDNPVSPGSFEGPLSGTVYNEDGIPVRDVGVHYLFALTPIRSLSKPGETCPSTVIEYTIQARGHVRVRILRWYTLQPVDTLIDEQQSAGNYTLSFNAAKMDNGLHIYEVTVDAVTTMHRLLLLNTDVASLVETVPLTSTDAKGKFSLPYGAFGFGVGIYTTPYVGRAVGDSVGISTSISLVLYKDGYQPLIRPVTIDTTKAMSMTFTLSR